MIVITWVQIFIIIALNIAGWAFSWLLSQHRHARNEAVHLGEIKGTVEGVNSRVESLEGRIGTLESNLSNNINALHERIDTLIDGWPSNISDEPP